MLFFNEFSSVNGSHVELCDQTGLERFLHYTNEYTSIAYNQSIAFSNEHGDVYAFYFTLSNGEITCLTKRYTSEYLEEIELDKDLAVKMLTSSFDARLVSMKKRNRKR